MKNLFKKIILILVSVLSCFIFSVTYWSNETQTVDKLDMLTKTVNELPDNWAASVSTTASYDTINIIDFLRTFKNYIFWLIAFFSICLFIYNWYRLIMADGKDEEMKKVFTAFVYSVVWLAIIPLSYVVIQLVTSFNF